MPDQFLLWDSAQVLSYLQNYVEQDITSAFIENNIDGSLLPFLTTEHLRELGIATLGTRLRVKRAINDLLAAKFAHGGPSGANDPDYRLNCININSNYVLMEALSLCTVLLRDLNKLFEPKTETEVLDIKKLNENFSKLKADLNPVIRLVKDSKPLPTPTLDPGVGVPLPTNSTNSIYLTNSWLTSEGDANAVPTTTVTAPLIIQPPNSAATTLTLIQTSLLPKLSSNTSIQRPVSVVSPTYSKRFSSGSIISMGVGKVADVKTLGAARYLAKPRLVEAKQRNSVHENESGDIPSLKLLQQLQLITGSGPPVLKAKGSTGLVTSSRSVTEMSSQPGIQPLKQLKASTDDTCLKVLQLAMRRHHIPREKWSKYVLVICYEDKERILKLTEKPVLVFKELQGHEKNPTIMLRELATSNPAAKDEYEDSRIGDNVPGGTL